MIINTNEILFRLKEALGLSVEEMISAYKLEAYEMETTHLENLLKRRQEKTFQLCSYEELGVFLDGLVTLKRGKTSKKPTQDEAIELTNNLILKKLRVALELKEAETEIVFGLGDATLTKQELKSLFRKEEHKNFKPCSSELLMMFLEGLNEFYFVSDEI